MSLSKKMVQAILEAALTELDEGIEPEQVISELATALGGAPQVYRPPAQLDIQHGVPSRTPDAEAPPPPAVSAILEEPQRSSRPSDVPGPGEPPIGGGHILTGSDNPDDQRLAAMSQKGGEAATMPCAEPGCTRNVPSSQNLPYCPQHMPKDNVLGIG